MNIKCIAFDLDDTIYLERDYILSGFKAVSKYLHRTRGISEKETFEFLVKTFGKGIRGKNFNLLIEKFAIPNSELTKLIDIYRNHPPDIKPIEGMTELLAELSKSFRLAIITDGYIETQKLKVSALGIDRLVHRIIYTDEFGKERWKPDPLAFKTLKKYENLKNQEAIYIADNPLKDFIPAKATGFITIKVSYPGALYSSVPSPEASEPDYRVNSVESLRETLNLLCAEQGCHETIIYGS